MTCLNCGVPIEQTLGAFCTYGCYEDFSEYAQQRIEDYYDDGKHGGETGSA